MNVRKGWYVVLMLLVLLAAAPLQAFAEETNRNEVRAQLARGGWSVVYGDLINEADYAKFVLAVASAVAAENPAPIFEYFDDQLQQQMTKIQRTAPEISAQAAQALLMRAFKTKGQVFRQGKLELSAGVATYKRWEKVIYNEPRTYKCKQKLPFGGWTWSVCSKTERVEKQVPYPNNHQPYVRFRWASTASAPAAGGAPAASGASNSNKRYGLLCLSNLTDWTINYSYRWGDGEWKESKIASNATRTHWWNYASGSQSSPEFTIRFDADMTGGANNKKYNLKRLATNDTNCNSGKLYEFKKAAGQTIELFASTK